MAERDSHFDGGVIDTLVISIAVSIVTTITLGLAFPWMLCWAAKKIADLTTVEGHRLAFDGKGGQLFGNYIKWLLLTIITIGIYGFWVPSKVLKWVAKHSYFAN